MQKSEADASADRQKRTRWTEWRVHDYESELLRLHMCQVGYASWNGRVLKACVSPAVNEACTILEVNWRQQDRASRCVLRTSSLATIENERHAANAPAEG